MLRVLVNAPWYVPNGLIHRDLKVPTVREVIAKLSVHYKLTRTTWRIYQQKTKRKTEDWKDLNHLIWQPGSLRPPSYLVIALSWLLIVSPKHPLQYVVFFIESIHWNTLHVLITFTFLSHSYYVLVTLLGRLYGYWREIKEMWGFVNAIKSLTN